MIFSVGVQERKCGEALGDLLLGFGTGETLQKLLEDETGAQNAITGFEGMHERVDLGDIRWSIAAQQQRPDTGVD